MLGDLREIDLFAAAERTAVAAGVRVETRRRLSMRTNASSSRRCGTSGNWASLDVLQTPLDRYAQSVDQRLKMSGPLDC